MAQKTERDLSAMFQESRETEAPGSYTYAPIISPKLSKGATLEIPSLCPSISVAPNAERKEVKRSIDESVKAKEKATWKITEVDGFYYILAAVALFLVSVAVVMILMAYTVWSNGTHAGRAADGLAGLVDTKLKLLPRDGEAWAHMEEVATKIDGYYNGLKSIWPWGK